MAQGPDPNRHDEVDPELSAVEESRGRGLGSPSTTRLGLSPPLITLLVVVIAVVLLALIL
jgi:hypothetical protein